MDLLKALIVVSEKAANVARLCRQDSHLFQLLIQKKTSDEANPRFVDDFKTLADVLIQEVVKYDIGNRFPQLRESIKGEENNNFSNKLGETIEVQIKETEEETSSLLQTVLNGDIKAADLLAAEVHREVGLEEVKIDKVPEDGEQFSFEIEDLGIWIDPIDSTAEYINGIEETSESGISISGLKCVTVLIGVYDKNSGIPVLGVVNQPFVCQSDDRSTGVCFWGTPTTTSLPSSSPTLKTICVSSSEDQSVITKLKHSGYTITEASGAGYKILTVATGLADVYLLTKNSTFKWDTCGPQAILRGLGGDVIVYDDAINGRITSVTYEESGGRCNGGGIIAYRQKDILDDVITCLSTSK